MLVAVAVVANCVVVQPVILGDRDKMQGQQRYLGSREIVEATVCDGFRE